MAYTRVHIVLVLTGNFCKHNLNSQLSIQLLYNVSFSNLVWANINAEVRLSERGTDNEGEDGFPLWMYVALSFILQFVKLLVSKQIVYKFQCKICHSFYEISSASGGEAPGPHWGKAP